MLATAIVVLYALLPITLLSTHSLPSGIFYVLIATSVVLLFQKRFEGALEAISKYRWLLISYSLLFLVVTASSLYHREWAGANSEGALRFLVGLGILLIALPHVNFQRMQQAVWGVYAAGVISTVILLWLIINVKARPLTPGVIITTYSSIMLLLSALAAYSLKWQLTPATKVEVVLKIVVVGITFAGFLAAQTRTGLLGLPIFVVVGLLLFAGVARPKKLVMWLIVASVLFGAAVVSNGALRERIAEGIQEVQACHGENSTKYNSMCIRLQLWRTAIDAGTQHPWLGMGDGGKFIDYLQQVAIPRGLAAQYVVDEYFGEPHNDLLLMFFGFGLPGVFALLLIYLTPCLYFLPRLLNRNASAQSRAAAAMGLAVCLGFFFFGLTETMFRRMNTVGFYSAMVAWFMVLSDPKGPQAGTTRQSGTSILP
ncbi:O-antigen ligase family protein [Pusillimonas sp.]|uniref:O-antigen ligase family protein n=1 Tax=Pusillimonas sp. TaxID=3040095 RepID=UPI0029A2862B|nr:O-antigen ligase family protein [Pusillimonas sp.]MDX3895322.1 O-antigen ligase family protein [Pusillimonas sp.]